MDINFGANVTKCSVIFDVNGNYGIANNNMYIHGSNWNGQAAFPNGVKWTRCSLSSKLNRRVAIPNSVTNMVNTFRGCYKLNQNIQTPNSVTNMAYTFNFCNSLNQNIQIPNSVTDIAFAFSSCYNLNQNIQIPNSVTDMSSAFYLCNSLNQNIQIPNGVTNIAFTFSSCNNLSNIAIIPKTRTIRNTNSMIRSNATKSINIWTDSATAINIMNAGFIQGNIKPTMETIDNGYYNAQYNVYIYTNAVFPS